MTVTLIKMISLAPGSLPTGGGGGRAACDRAADRGPEGFPNTGSSALSSPDLPSGSAALIFLGYLWTHPRTGGRGHPRTGRH